MSDSVFEAVMWTCLGCSELTWLGFLAWLLWLVGGLTLAIVAFVVMVFVFLAALACCRVAGECSRLEEEGAYYAYYLRAS